MKVYDNGIYRDMTPEETTEFEKLNTVSPETEIEQLKQQLAQTDYKALKFAEGWLTDEEYAPIKAERQTLRDRINELENNTTN